MSADERMKVVEAYCGERGNRRHKPGRALERTFYRFDVLSDGIVYLVLSGRGKGSGNSSGGGGRADEECR